MCFPEQQGDYPLRSITKEFINGHKFNCRISCWYVVFEADMSKEKLLNVNLSAKLLKENLLKVNPSDVGRIIPPSFRKNDLHCVFIQVRKLAGYFSSIVQFFLRGEL